MAGEARQKLKQLCLNEEIQVENMLRRKEPQAGTVPHRNSGYKKKIVLCRKSGYKAFWLSMKSI